MRGAWWRLLCAVVLLVAVAGPRTTAVPVVASTAKKPQPVVVTVTKAAKPALGKTAITTPTKATTTTTAAAAAAAATEPKGAMVRDSPPPAPAVKPAESLSAVPVVAGTAANTAGTAANTANTATNTTEGGKKDLEVVKAAVKTGKGSVIGIDEGRLPFFAQVCVGIPAARRYASDGTAAPKNYLRDLMEKLYAPVPKDQQHLLDVHVFNVDHSPRDHLMPTMLAKQFEWVTAEESKVNTTALEASLPGLVMDSFEGIPVTKTKQVWRAKEVLDNIDVLDTCHKSGRKYTLFLEDDVLPTSDLWRKLERFVKQMPDNYAFLNLYNPSVWEPEDLELHNGDRYSFFCCTQSMLFANSRLPPILESLRKGVSREPVDHLLVEYLKANPDLPVYVAIPNLFQHVGAYSTLAERTQSPPEVAHESLSWEALLQPTKGEHLALPPSRSCDAHYSTSFVL